MIIIIISIINAVLEEKRKSNRVGHVHMHVIFVLTFFLFVFWLFLVKKLLCFLRIYNCICKFDKNKNKNLFNKKN